AWISSLVGPSPVWVGPLDRGGARLVRWRGLGPWGSKLASVDTDELVPVECPIVKFCVLAKPIVTGPWGGDSGLPLRCWRGPGTVAVPCTGGRTGEGVFPTVEVPQGTWVPWVP